MIENSWTIYLFSGLFKPKLVHVTSKIPVESSPCVLRIRLEAFLGVVWECRAVSLQTSHPSAPHVQCSYSSSPMAEVIHQTVPVPQTETISHAEHFGFLFCLSVRIPQSLLHQIVAQGETQVVRVMRRIKSIITQ